MAGIKKTLGYIGDSKPSMSTHRDLGSSLGAEAVMVIMVLPMFEVYQPSS